MALTLRPATDADKGFARRVYIETTRPYVGHLPDWTDDYLTARFERRFIVAATRMIVRDAGTVGWVRLSDTGGEIVLEQLYVDPACHKQGIGTAIMTALVREWRGGGKPVALRVLRRNPACHLYRRFGFRIVDEAEPNSFGMRLAPAPAQA